MDYPLENLNPERFQEFCQALLIREHPNIQCFPVAQPDGGRDAISYLPDPWVGKFVVFQVKYARRPLAESDPHKWLLAVMEEESPKLHRLLPRGASHFYLITNIPGTAHLDAGAIDKLNEEIGQHLTIPFSCWWRDDLNRRLDNAWALKWVYPELMTGPDFLRAVIESGIRDARDRREAALRAFVSQQYAIDEQVRFKQIELQNNLLDLFVDVPAGFRSQSGDPRQAYLFRGVIRSLSSTIDDGDDSDVPFPSVNYEHRSSQQHDEPGAAALLLNVTFQDRFPHAVLEGAPGQGKSTVVQYVCQVHRMKLLGNTEALATIPQEHRDIAFRLPIKIDLRDFATWLDKKDPFGPEGSREPPNGWRKSLEAFIAALITAQSGGANFTTDDLLAVLKISSVLCVFDGLDEVADIIRRREVVEEITKGVQRLEANAASLQTVVTSRPAAFANSPGMPAERYPYLHLTSLSRRHIDRYAERWLRARRIDGKEASEFKRTLRDKLDQPHLRDLARSPMQLAILLSLISTRGASLPDKRTSLYDSYIDLFFNREAEKSVVVREHRELLIDIHRYLAWLLHSEAERGNSSGSISQDRLQSVLGDYLAREGYDPKWARALFTGMVERVVALVSRVEGTFEFEVQPLREYFAARFLYDTAPYSPPGGEQRGTKPDRFDALARNFYWTNVARFYAGCFSKGELAGLVERLQDLLSEEPFNLTTHPRMLAAMLLGDWVFTQNPRAVQGVINLILDESGLRYLVIAGSSPRRRRGIWNPIVLPPKCGQDQLVTACFDILAKHPALDYALDVIELARTNASPAELTQRWTQRFETSQAFRWLTYALHLGVLSVIDVGTLKRCIGGESATFSSLLYRARRLEMLEESEASFDQAIDSILAGVFPAQPQRRVESALDALAHAVNPYRYAVALEHRVPVPLSELHAQHNWPVSLLWEGELATNTEAFENHKKCILFSKIAAEEGAKTSAAEWATELEPWNRLIESGRDIFGDRWCFYSLANLAAGIKSNQIRCREFTELLDHSRALCPRVRYARLRSSNKTWWENQFRHAISADDRAFVCLVALTWLKADCLLGIVSRLDEALSSFHEGQWSQICRAFRRSLAWVHARIDDRAFAFDVSRLPNTLAPRTVVALGARAVRASAHELYKKYLSNVHTGEHLVLEYILDDALDESRLGGQGWSPDLDRIQECYAAGATNLLRRGRRGTSQMPIEIAKTIARAPSRFPTELLVLAEEVCRREAADAARPVATIAEQAAWFGSTAHQKAFYD